jgi:hypothetical protein
MCALYAQAGQLSALKSENGAQAEKITALESALAKAVLAVQAAADTARVQTDQVAEAIQRMVAAIPTAPTRATSGGSQGGGGGNQGGIGETSIEATGQNIVIGAPNGVVKLESSGCSVDDLCAVERLDTDGETAIATLAALIDALRKLELE